MSFGFVLHAGLDMPATDPLENPVHWDWRRGASPIRRYVLNKAKEEAR